MNQAQIVNLIVTLVVGATTTTVAKVGINPTDWTTDVTDLVLLTIAVGTWFYAHQFHAIPVQPTPPK